MKKLIEGLSSYLAACFTFLILLLGINDLGICAPIKVGVLAPDGTNWANKLQKMSQAVKTATNGEVEFKMYLGGVSGDEPDVLRKIRVGQLQGGIFTGRTLGDIYGDVRVIELPFNFKKDRVKAWKTLQKFAPTFDKGFTKNGFKNLGYFELGNVYVVSTKKVNNINELKGIKIWSWEGDKLASGLVESLDLVSVPLALPDVLSSLSTGVIEAAYANPLGVIALQWQTKIKYLVDFPVTFSMGAFLITDKVWSKVPEKYKSTVESIVKKFVDEANLQTIQENEEALAVLKKNGVEFISFPNSDISRGEEIREKVIKKLTGPIISQDMVKAFNEQAKKI